MSEHIETNRHIIMQEMIEERYNRKHIDAKIRKELENSEDIMARVAHGVELLTEWMAGDYYESKMVRIEQLKNLDLQELVMEIFVGTAYFLRPELYTSATAQMASRLKFSDRTDAITTVAEIMAVLCNTDVYDITKEHKQASLMLVSNIELSEELAHFMENSLYLPPMVCEPLELTHNFSSGYLTHNDSLILGSGNHHDGDLCLDVLNTINKVALTLDTEFLSFYEEVPTHVLETQDQINNWRDFKEQSYGFYKLMVDCGNRFYFTHKPDKRGRLYSQGYHINPQGTSFKKAQLEFADMEVVQGVPQS